MEEERQGWGRVAERGEEGQTWKEGQGWGVRGRYKGLGADVGGERGRWG